jgi:hypothetical protein
MKKYSVPADVKNEIRKAISSYSGTRKKIGFVSAKNILDNGDLTFANLKKLKHEYETGDSVTKALLGGEKFKSFVDTELDKESKKNRRHKDAREITGIKNPHRRPKNSFLKEIINKNLTR